VKSSARAAENYRCEIFPSLKKRGEGRFFQVIAKEIPLYPPLPKWDVNAPVLFRM